MSSTAGAGWAAAGAGLGAEGSTMGRGSLGVTLSRAAIKVTTGCELARGESEPDDLPLSAAAAVSPRAMNNTRMAMADFKVVPAFLMIPSAHSTGLSGEVWFVKITQM